MPESKIIEQAVKNGFSEKDFKSLNTYATKYLWFFVVVGLISVFLQAFDLPSSLFSLCYNVVFTIFAITAILTTKRFNTISYYVNFILLNSVLISVFVLCIRFGSLFFLASDGVMGLIGDRMLVSSTVIIAGGILVVLVAISSCVFSIYYLTIFISNKKAFTKK